MKKINPSYCNGIEYIILAHLPPNQSSMFQSWLPAFSFTKLFDGEQIIKDCIPYETYEYWFDHFFIEEAYYGDSEI